MRWIKLAAVLTLWGISFILNEIALRDVGPVAVVAGRWLVTAVLIAGLLAQRGELGRFRAGLNGDGRRFFVLSLFGVTLLYGLQVVGQARTSAVNTGLLANTVPVFTALLAAVFLGERLRAAGWAGIFVALLGAWIVSAGGLRFELNTSSAAGDLLVLLSAMFGAVYFVVGKDLLESHSPLVVTAAAATLGAATLAPLAAIEHSWPAFTWQAGLVVVILGLGPGLLSNLWWWETAEWLDASRAALYIYLIPLITMFFAVVFLDETISPAQIGGAAFVLGGVWLAEQGVGEGEREGGRVGGRGRERE